ncbi:MAG: FAD-dependent thymidylate synthase [Oscillospiraceae bacterium]|jgi:thymidylate synthase (FAD)|nr:FAD-dependent thymidylate synthase [Oscillospiraceae bacterium]
MKIINAGYEILDMPERKDILELIEKIGRVCYKSEDRITPESAGQFVSMIIKSGHESVLEHATVSVKFICDRGVSHEIVRHRIASYSQESTRYCNYSKDKFGGEITVIRPFFWDEESELYRIWKNSAEEAERSYFDLLKSGATPEQARSVLPNSLKTELCTTMNLRQWRHFFKLRTSEKSHPQMREIAVALQEELREILPEIFVR